MLLILYLFSISCLDIYWQRLSEFFIFLSHFALKRHHEIPYKRWQVKKYIHTFCNAKALNLFHFIFASLQKSAPNVAFQILLTQNFVYIGSRDIFYVYNFQAESFDLTSHFMPRLVTGHENQIRRMTDITKDSIRLFKLYRGRL